MAVNHTELAEEYGIPRWSTGFWGSRFFGVCGGFLMDLLTEGAATALDGSYSSLFKPSSNPYDKPADALRALGRSANLPIFITEDVHTTYRARLDEKWTFWTSGPEASLESILTVAAGRPVDVLVPGDFASPPDGFTDYWSRFWVSVSSTGLGDPISGAGSADEYGDGTVYGDGSTYGPEGVTAEYYARITAAARRYKPVQWVLWDIEYVVGGTTFRSMVFPRIDPSFVPQAS